MSLEYRVLGRLEVVRDGVPIELGAFRQRALLALLIANAGTVLSTDRILDELWGETGGTDKQNSLWVYVSGLRGALEPGRAKRSEGTILLTRAPGYVMVVDRDDTDVGRFERAVAEARAVADVDPNAASDTLRAALAMWRGHPYEEFAYESWAQNEITRLEELRLEAIEHRIDADLRLGLSRELVSELLSLVRQHPLRERFVTSLMLALYRSGRAAEALRVASSFSSRLVSDTGVEPSLALRDLQHRILVDDADLLADVDFSGGPRRPRAGLTVRGYELREELGRGAFGSVFRAYQPVIGREVAVKVIKQELADDPTFIRRFDAEAQLVAGLEHPHIVPLYDYWREPGAAYLVMRLVETGTLADALTNGGLEPDRAARVFAQMASALSAAHRNGVVHGDVTPENILLDRDGNAYLSDFGVAIVPDARGREMTPGSADAVPYPGRNQRTSGPPTPASDIDSLALVAATALSGFSGEYEQVRGALPPAVRTVLDRATATDPARRYSDASTFGQALTDALGAPTTPLVHDAAIENPYRGLRPFGAGDAGHFFGRERLVERLVARLGEPGTRGRFIAVVGPSGSGKSSVVRAGLLPAVARGAIAMSTEWYRIDMTPAPHPFEQLEAALLPLATDAPNALIDLLLTPGGVRRAIRRVLPDDDGQLLLVIDQFEELFTQVDDDTANRFIDEVVDLVTAPGTRVRVVITLRADFYDRPLRHRGLGELLRDGTEVITPMSIDELEAAITGPAAKVGVEIEPLVVTEMVGEIIDRPGALPLLQYTLTELFEGRAGRTITVAAYRAGGGVSRTLARRADSLLAGLGPETIETTRNVLLRLVSLNTDGTGTDTRRRALVAEVDELDDRWRVQRVLDTFGRHRLLSFDRDPITRGPTVEISHEALLTEWTTLRTWIDDARDDLRTHKHLVTEMHAWIAADRSPDFLLRGGRLETTAAWASSTTMRLRPTEREFLDASVAAQVDAQRERLEEHERAASAERRARRRTRQLAIAALVTALVAGLATFAWVQRRDARAAEADLAGRQEAQRLANLALTTLDDDPQLSLLLAIEAVRSTAELGYAVPEAIDATHWALQDLGVQYDVTADSPVAARLGQGGPRGVWLLSVQELIDLAASHAGRALTIEECESYLGGGCPAARSLTGVGYLNGSDDYATLVALDEAEVTVGVRVDGDEQADEWQQNLDAIGEQYGLRPRLVQIPGNLSPTDAATQGIEADIYVIAPRELPDLLAERPLVDLRQVIDEATLLDDYGEHVVSLSRVGSGGTWPSDTGPIYGVAIAARSKTVVWTKEPEFTDFGYERPSAWTSFTSLADTIVEDGHTPFCIGLGSGPASGWPATDWVEMVVLRTAGPDVYDAWIEHDVPFDHPVVVDALRTIGHMLLRPGALNASAAEAADEEFLIALDDLVEEPGACLMTLYPSFLPEHFEHMPELPLSAFPLPTFESGHGDAVVGDAALAVAVTDRPEVRALIGALATPDWGLGATHRDWPSQPPANARFNPAAMANPVMSDIVKQVQDAIRSDEFRFDASDLMPGAVESAFRSGMVRLLREGSLENLDELAHEIAQDIEAAWLTAEGTGG